MLGLKGVSRFLSASGSLQFVAGRRRSGHARKQRRADLAARTDRVVTVGPIILVDLAGLTVLGDPVVLVARRDLVALAVLGGLEGRAARAMLVVVAAPIVVVAGGNHSRDFRSRASSDPGQRLTTFIPPSA